MKISILVLVAVLLSACGSGGSSDNGNSGSDEVSENTSTNTESLDTDSTDTDSTDTATENQSPSTNTSRNSANLDSALGANISANNYWSTEWHFVDAFKRASTGTDELWLTQCDGCDWNTEEAIDMDDKGWVRSLPAANDNSTQYRYVSTLLFFDIGSRYPAGDYTVIYEGEGTLTYDFDAVKDEQRSRPGRDIVRVDNPAEGFLLTIRETDPNGTGNYIRNIRVIFPGGTCGGDRFFYAQSAVDCIDNDYQPFTDTYQQQPFHPLFLAETQRYKALRFMQMLQTVDTRINNWSQRTALDDATWGTSQGTGVPYEIVLAMANTLDASPWLNIPTRVDDDYVRRFAQLALDNLDDDLTVYVEYYNEAWNTAFPFEVNGSWIADQGEAHWPNSEESRYTKRINWFAKRTVEMCTIWRDVWGSEADRINCVMGGFIGLPWANQEVLNCPLVQNEFNGLACANFVDSLAVGPYFGVYLWNADFQDELAGWLDQPDGGLDRLFDEIFNGVLHDPADPDPAPEGGALEEVSALLADTAAITNQFHLPLIAYEGGQHLTLNGNMEGVNQAIHDLFGAANRDPRMGQAYDQWLQEWRSAGGELMVVFESVVGQSIWGHFGVKEYQGQPLSEAPKFDALMRFLDTNPCWWDNCEQR